MPLVVTQNAQEEDPPAETCVVHIDVRYDNGERFQGEFPGIDPTEIGPVLIDTIRAHRKRA